MTPNFTNQKLIVVKKWLSDILGDKSDEHLNILERVCTVLVTNKDLEEFGKLFSDIYEVAYQKAISDNKKQLEKMGYSVEIKTK